jgi:hypothetical protein
VPFTQQVDGVVDHARGVGQGFLAFHHAHAGELAEGVYVFGGNHGIRGRGLGIEVGGSTSGPTRSKGKQIQAVCESGSRLAMLTAPR